MSTERDDTTGPVEAGALAGHDGVQHESRGDQSGAKVGGRADTAKDELDGAVEAVKGKVHRKDD